MDAYFSDEDIAQAVITMACMGNTIIDIDGETNGLPYDIAIFVSSDQEVIGELKRLYEAKYGQHCTEAHHTCDVLDGTVLSAESVVGSGDSQASGGRS